MQSLEPAQQFGYLFYCAGWKLIMCCNLKEHCIIIIGIHKRKISTDFPKLVSLEES